VLVAVVVRCYQRLWVEFPEARGQWLSFPWTCSSGDLTCGERSVG